MFDDRNKTELTKSVTAAAVHYLAERGCKPLETEVPVSGGWIADLAGVIDPTVTELIELKFIKRRPEWESPQEKRDAWDRDLSSYFRLLTVLVEVKTSRSDFVGDKKWMIPIPTDAAYLALPAGMVTPDEWPDGWGILLYCEAQDYVKLARLPILRQATDAEQRDTILSIAIRRDHHTRYERIRSLSREQRTRQNEDILRRRVSTVMHAMLDIVNGKHDSSENALSFHGIKHLPSWEIKKLEKLWAINVSTPEAVTDLAALLP